MHILLYIFVGIVAIQLFYYLFVFAKFALAKETTHEKKSIPISVIICIKNEAPWIEKNLPLFLKQQYSKFELVLVDDASGDNSLDIIEAFAEKNAQIKIVKVKNVEAFWGNRKFALTLGIKAASHENLLFTSIQSEPVSEFWIENMGKHFSNEKSIVLGHTTYKKAKKSPLNFIYRFEKMLDTMSTFGWTKLGVPYKGNGKNLAYSRSEFFNVRGFNDHMKIRLGEDVLFVNQAATATNTDFCINPESFVALQAPKSFSYWFNEKRIQQETVRYIKLRDQWMLRIFNSSQFLFFIFGVLLMLTFPHWEIILGLILARYACSWTIIGFSAKKLNDKDLLIWYPLLEIVWVFIRINMLFTNLFSKPAN
jgi:glycosyltransferase involved in cell wall biosynthesis